jgi:hypothetical protein
MKQKNVQLDVDFIGGDKPLTDKEEKQLSDYFKNLDELHWNRQIT